MIVNQKDGKVLCTAFSKGSDHDFKLFKNSGLKLARHIKILADSGYQGIQKIHPNAQVPTRASKLRPLTQQDKKANTKLSKKRIKVENAISFIKRFKIFSTKYRNRKKRFGLRFNLFAAICNFEINLP